MKQLGKSWFLLLAITISWTATAEIYKWTDENGKVHFSDKQPTNKDAETLDEQALASRYSSYAQVAVKVLPYDASKNRKPDKLVIYTTTHCGYCAKARKYFAEKKIPYKEKNIETSKKYNREFKKFGGKGVPVLFWGKYKMTGFSVARFEKMYSKSV
ncbi:glutaredoxin domain-containing protein [Colwelliaceae bacterium 6471]